MTFLSFRGGHFENHPKWRVDPKISSVNVLILNQESPLNKMIPFVEVAEGGPLNKMILFVEVAEGCLSSLLSCLGRSPFCTLWWLYRDGLPGRQLLLSLLHL